MRVYEISPLKVLWPRGVMAIALIASALLAGCASS